MYRYNPENLKEGKNPLKLDYKEPSIPVKDFAYNETRYKMLTQTNEERAEELMKLAQADADQQSGEDADVEQIASGAVAAVALTGLESSTLRLSSCSSKVSLPMAMMTLCIHASLRISKLFLPIFWQLQVQIMN